MLGNMTDLRTASKCRENNRHSAGCLVRTILSSLCQVRLKNFVCISPHLPRFQVIEIEALSILKNLGIDVGEKILFRVESHVFAGKSLKVSGGCTNSYS